MAARRRVCGRLVPWYALWFLLAAACGFGPSAHAADYFTEQFTGGAFDVRDVANMTLMLTPVAGGDRYRANAVPAETLPTDPAGHNPLGLGDDSSVPVIPSRSLLFYGTSYSMFHIGSNGHLTFDGASSAREVELSVHFAAKRISAFLTDLDPSSGGAISWGEESDRVVVTYVDVPHYGTEHLNTFQVEMFYDGRIHITWLRLDTYNAVCGISEGQGVPGDFTESDLSEYPPPDQPEADWGDHPDTGAGTGPDNYRTTAADDGPRHTIAAGVFLGRRVDAETNGLPTLVADGDDADGVDDEDGVLFPPALVPGVPGSIEVVAGQAGYLNAWVDWDRDGDFADTVGGQSEHVIVDRPLPAGTNTLSVGIVPDGILGRLHARFRFTADDPNGELGPSGLWGNGEVEDYALGMIAGLVWTDKGDGTPGDGIRSGTEAGLVGVRVTLYDDSTQTPVATDTTDVTGAYAFVGLPPGDYAVGVMSPVGFSHSPRDQGGNDDIDSDPDPATGRTPGFGLSPGRVLTHVDAGLVPPTVQFSLSTQTVSEAAATVRATISASVASSRVLEIPITVAGTATEGQQDDYVITTGIPTQLAAGSMSTDIVLTVNNDLLDEYDETVLLFLDEPPVAMLGVVTSHTVTIADDDPMPLLSVSNTVAGESAGMALFTVWLSAESGREVTVRYATAPGDASAGSDYVHSTGMLTFPPGVTNLIVAVSLPGDTTDEADEWFSLSLSSPSNALLDPHAATATATILDDDAPPSLTMEDVIVGEDAGNATVVLSLSQPSGRDIRVDVTTDDLEAVSPGDYTGTNGTLTIPKNSPSVSLLVPIIDDNVYEGGERFAVVLYDPQHVTLADTQAVVTISGWPVASPTNRYTWQAAAGWIDWKPADAGVVFRDPVLGGRIWHATLGWINLGDGTPDHGIRYSNTNATDFGVNHDGAGRLYGYAWAATAGWIAFEQSYGKPTYDFQTGRLGGYAWSTTFGWINLGQGVSRSIRFLEDDPPPVLAIADVAVNESAGSATFSVVRSGSPTEVPAMVEYATEADTAWSGQDFVSTNGTLLIPPSGSGTGAVRVVIVEDALDEFDETYGVRLANAVGARLTNTLGRGTIIDNDLPPELSLAGVTVDENAGMAYFDVILSAVSGRDIIFRFLTRDGTAYAGQHYLPIDEQVILPGGMDRVSVGVVMIDNDLDHADTIFMIGITNAMYAGIAAGADTATITIRDDDPPPGLSIADVTVVEADRSAHLTVSLSAPSGWDIRAGFSTADGTAVAPSDYVATNGTLTIPWGATTGVVVVPIVYDLVREPSEDLSVVLSNAVHAGLSDATGRVSIVPGSTIAPDKSSSWAANVGWLRGRYGKLGAVVSESSLSGRIWCATTGWLDLGDGSPTNGVRYGNLTPDDFGVNRDEQGRLTGYAWSPVSGWVAFEQTHGQPRVSGVTGRFSGYAWSAAAGWINLGENTSHYVKSERMEITDTDGDGMDDAWEIARFGDTTQTGHGVDSDGDGATDLDEYLAGTDPRDPTDVFQVSAMSLPSGPGDRFVQITFPSSQTHFYRIQYNEDVAGAGAWIDSGLGEFVPDPGPTTTRTVVVPAGTIAAFFRILAIRPLSAL